MAIDDRPIANDRMVWLVVSSLIWDGNPKLTNMTDQGSNRTWQSSCSLPDDDFGMNNNQYVRMLKLFDGLEIEFSARLRLVTVGLCFCNTSEGTDNKLSGE